MTFAGWVAVFAGTAAAAGAVTVAVRAERRGARHPAHPASQVESTLVLPAPEARAPQHFSRPVSTPLPFVAKPAPHTTVARAIAPVTPAATAAPIVRADETAVPAPPTPAPPVAELAPVEVSALPRSVQVMTVPVPASLLESGDVQYQVVPQGNAQIIGALTGTVRGSAASQPVVVTAALSKSAPAGTQTVARVEFRQGGAVRSEVPVRVQILTVHSAQLRLAQSVIGGHPGERVTLRYFLTNSGNGPDSISIRMMAPVGWRVDGAPTLYVLGAGASVTGEVGIWVPRESGTGSLPIAVIASAGGRDIARADAGFEVVAGEVSAVSADELQVTTGVASVLTSQNDAPVFGVDVMGPVAAGISAVGHLVQPTNSGTADALSLSRVGYYLGGTYLTLSGAQWSATGGATGRTFSDVTGMNAYGQGAAFTLNDQKWTADLLGAAPAAGEQSSNGHLLGARVGMKVDGGWVGATATDLRDNLFSARELEAIGIGGVSPAFSGFTVAGELAHRSYAGGQGIGWSAEVDQRSVNTQFQIRALGAPGGAAAYARAQSEVAAVATHRIGALELDASGFLSSDQNQSFAKLQSAGWSFTPQLQVNSHVTLNLGVQGNSYTARGAVGEFGSDETSVRAGLNFRAGTFYALGALSAGQVSRSTMLPATPQIVDAGGKYGLQGTAGIATDRGTFEASLDYEQSAQNVGYLPHQATLTVRADNVPLRSGGGPRLHAEVDQYLWFGALPSVTLVRVGVVAPLPGDLKLTVDVQHNPLIAGPAGGNRWVPVVKLERSLGVTFSGEPALVRGVVYEDRNGNGSRDPGEPGIAGVVIRRGNETAVTSKNGEFTLYQQTTDPLRVDETSLPFGLVANPSGSARLTEKGRVEIGVWPTASVDVRLVPTADETGRVPRVDLRSAQVDAVDSAGNSWSARVDSTGHARFDALPPGSYHLEFSLQDVREPVHAQGAAPRFVVLPGRTVAPIAVPLYPRPVRLFDPTNQRGRGAQRGQSGQAGQGGQGGQGGGHEGQRQGGEG